MGLISGLLGGLGVPTTGLIGQIGNGLSSNSNMLLGLATGGGQGAVQGARADALNALQQKQEDEKKQKLAAAMQLAQSQHLPPEFAQAFPDQVGQIVAQRFTPKEQSLDKMIWGRLTPEQQNEYIQNNYLKPKGTDLTSQYNQRIQMAAGMGLQPNDPAYKSFVLTGKMPREDQAPLTATDKKAILEADEQVAAAENAIRGLDEAEKLSPNAYEGKGASTRAAIGNNLPDWLVPDVIASPEKSATTAGLDNTVTSNALAQMKAIFGSNPTEGERAILLEIQGAANQPRAVREEIFKRARIAVQKRLEFNRQRAAELRGGTYYKGGAGQPQQGNDGSVVIDGYKITPR